MSKTIRECVRDGLLSQLYDDQYKYWHKQLNEIAQENSLTYGNTKSPFGLFYLGKVWVGDPDYLSGINKALYSFPLQTLGGELEKRLISVVAELSELDNEKYEVTRFISGLLSLAGNLHTILEHLGSQLYSICKEYLNGYQYIEHLDESANLLKLSKHQIKLYVEKHTYIIDSMRARLVLNLISDN